MLTNATRIPLLLLTVDTYWPQNALDWPPWQKICNLDMSLLQAHAWWPWVVLPPSQAVNEGQSSQAIQQKRKFGESEMGETQGAMPVLMVIDLKVETDGGANKLVEVEPRKRVKHNRMVASMEGTLATVKKAVVQVDEDEDEDEVMRR